MQLWNQGDSMTGKSEWLCYSQSTSFDAKTHINPNPSA